ncbi:MAG: hypothetical protein ACK5LJ_13015 [Paracoccus sp. (in: a-proteobacteria)]
MKIVVKQMDMLLHSGPKTTQDAHPWRQTTKPHRDHVRQAEGLANRRKNGRRLLSGPHHMLRPDEADARKPFSPPSPLSSFAGPEVGAEEYPARQWVPVAGSDSDDLSEWGRPEGPMKETYPQLSSFMPRKRDGCRDRGGGAGYAISIWRHEFAASPAVMGISVVIF